MTPEPLRGKTWYPPQLITQFYLNATQLRAIARLQVLAETHLRNQIAVDFIRAERHQ